MLVEAVPGHDTAFDSLHTMILQNVFTFVSVYALLSVSQDP